MTIRLVKRPYTGEGIPIEVGGIKAYELVIYETWECNSKAAYDNPETVWKEKGFDEIPSWVEDKDGNRY